MNKKNQLSRRQFIGQSALGYLGLTMLPKFGCKSPNDTINIGFIGLGQQAMFLLNSFINMEGVRVIAGSDVYSIKRDRFEQRVNKHYSEKGITNKVVLYEHYEDLLANKDVDAVIIATPDHWHALNAIHACQAGKDIYLEKPLTFTIKEGIKLVKAVNKNNRILGVGSQQRSDPNFQYAIQLVHDGKIGELEKVSAFVGSHPTPYDLPEEPVPQSLNWDLWIGPAPYIHYNHQLNPLISLDPPQNEEYWAKWRYFKETGGGLITDWGAHMFDIAQWGMKTDRSGPVKVIPAGYEDTENLTFGYESGLKMVHEQFNGDIKGVKFWGADGWIEVARGHFLSSNPGFESPLGKEKGPYETKVSHQADFINALRERRQPIVPVEVGHRTCTTCTLGNIAHELKRPLKWDPANENFVNDPEAEKLLHRPYEHGYKLPVV